MKGNYEFLCIMNFNLAAKTTASRRDASSVKSVSLFLTHPKDATHSASIPCRGCGWQVRSVVTELSSAKADVYYDFFSKNKTTSYSVIRCSM